MTIKKRITLATIISILTIITMVISVYASIYTYGRKRIIKIVDDRIECRVGYDVKLIQYMITEHVGDSIANEAKVKLALFRSDYDTK